VLWQVFIIGSLEQGTIEIAPKMKLNIYGNVTVTDEHTGDYKRNDSYSVLHKLYVNHIIRFEVGT
jgi:hypothetical protein